MIRNTVIILTGLFIDVALVLGADLLIAILRIAAFADCYMYRLQTFRLLPLRITTCADS